jgi:glutathione synthase/RimK-type ligase-like ATP-grasp enzyme
MQRTYQIGIVTLAGDLHGITIQKTLESYDNIKCHIIESDRISNNNSINWSTTNLDPTSTIITREKEHIAIRDLDVIWWRRFNYPQIIQEQITDNTVIDLINNDCSDALLGAMVNGFSGTWINDPFATRKAENKLIQLKVAKRAGFNIPRTIVSQDPEKIKKFCKLLNNNVIVKPIKGTNLRPIFTRKITEEHLKSNYSIQLAPAIYQEYIPGDNHIRAHCFGDSVYSVLIDSKELDWRENLDVPFRIIDLDINLKTSIINVVKDLGLKMGIIDLKLLNDSSPIWLEINPQGQFLFAEGLSDLNLTSYFCEFLYSEAIKVRNICSY